MNDHADLHTLTAAYTLDALPEDELLLFERHLVACPECREEVEDLTAAVVELAASHLLQAPAAMRSRVLELLASIPQS
ncbi:zf-HC2 domain-containing protein [Streptomyces sp. NPDC101209]|uniref:zf-HC2 domain-containing protein n=1 Tax=Streptomyces sp. NPDC101209 TaxID=3366129 RepID=UPI003817889C